MWRLGCTLWSAPQLPSCRQWEQEPRDWMRTQGHLDNFRWKLKMVQRFLDCVDEGCWNSLVRTKYHLPFMSDVDQVHPGGLCSGPSILKMVPVHGSHILLEIWRNSCSWEVNMKPILSACTGDRCVSSKACEQSGPLLGSKKLHAMWHLTKPSPAGIICSFQEGKKNGFQLYLHICVLCSLPHLFSYLL